MNLAIDKSETYLLACSFGPDSMALFDMLEKSGARFIVCHVNYHKRGDASNFEEKSLREYCEKRGIEFECLDTTSISKPNKKVNFQAWAREIRYNFFKDVYTKHNASGLFIAHQLDDSIETYLMQKNRNAYVSCYGIPKQSVMNNMIVIRPLLHLSKKELEQYDIDNKISYSIDASNLSNDYERNRIRHNIVEKLSKEEKEKLLNEIKIENTKLMDLYEKADRYLKNKNPLTTNDIKNLTDDDFTYVLFNLLNKYNVYSLSKDEVKSLKKLANSNKANIHVQFGDNVFYCQEYGEIVVYKKANDYSYQLDLPKAYSFKEFDIDFTDASDRGISEKDYPLTIRNADKNDEYIIKNYKKKVSRLFLDWKMPWHLRDQWPVILDKNGKIIYIPRYRKVYSDNHKSKLAIKVK